MYVLTLSPLRQPEMTGSTPSALTPETCIFFVSFFLGWWIPSWILELSGWWPPNESLRTDACYRDYWISVSLLQSHKGAPNPKQSDRRWKCQGSCLVFTPNIINVSDILSKMVKFCPMDGTHQSNADSVVVAELAICCHLGPGARRAESGGGCARTEGGVKTHHI